MIRANTQYVFLTWSVIMRQANERPICLQAYELCRGEIWGRSHFKNEQRAKNNQKNPGIFHVPIRKYLNYPVEKLQNSHITCLLQPFPQNNFPPKMSISCYCLKVTPIMAVSRTIETPTTSCWDLLCCISDNRGQYVDDKILSCHWIWKFDLKWLVSPYKYKVAGCIF